MTTDERIKEIEERRNNFCRVTDADHDFLLGLVKVQRELSKKFPIQMTLAVTTTG